MTKTWWCTFLTRSVVLVLNSDKQGSHALTTHKTKILKTAQTVLENGYDYR